MDFTIARKNGSGAIVWSEDQIRYIVSQYIKNDKTLKELANEFSTQSQSIRNLLRKQKIEITNKKTRNFPRDSYYFNVINTPEKAYWLGIMFSDGAVVEKTNQIALGLKDKEHLEKFQKAIQACNNKIITIEDNRFLEKKINYRFTICDKQLRTDLINLGCIPNKSYKNFNYPNIPEEYDWDFIRGYFDGDGSLYFSNNRYVISYVGNYQFLTDLKKKINKENITLCQNSISKITYDLKIAGRKDVERILNSMYQNSNENTRLNRKYETYQKCLTFLQAHHT